MKNLKHIFCLLPFLVLYSCNNFLNEEPVFQYVSNDMIFLFAENETHNAQLLGIADKKFTVYKKPTWLNLGFENGKFNSNGIFDFQCSVDKDFFAQDLKIFEDIIILDIENFGKCGVVVYYIMDAGNPELYVYPGKISFGRAETKSDFFMENDGNGWLIWEIKSCPQWLKCEQFKGIIAQHTTISINFECDRNLILSNFASDTLIISTNDKNYPVIKIPVSATKGSSAENLKRIEGTVTDAFMNTSTDLLYITTIQPDKLIVYDINSRNIVKTKSFDVAPNCMAFSEDKSKMAIGVDKKIFYLNVADLSEIKTINVDKTIFDIEFIDENTLCFTVYSRDNWYYIDIQNETINKFDSGYERTDQKTMIKKIPNKNYIVATCFETGPSGLLVFDLNTKKLVTNLNEELGRFWFSDDGVYMIDKRKRVILTDYSPNCSAVPVYKNINTERNLSSVAFNSLTNSVYCSIIDDSYYTCKYNITKFSMNDFSFVKNYYYDNYFKEDYNDYILMPHYLFVNENETELIALKGTYRESYDRFDVFWTSDIWVLEFIPIN